MGAGQVPARKHLTVLVRVPTPQDVRLQLPQSPISQPLAHCVPAQGSLVAGLVAGLHVPPVQVTARVRVPVPQVLEQLFQGPGTQVPE